MYCIIAALLIKSFKKSTKRAEKLADPQKVYLSLSERDATDFSVALLFL